MPWNLAVSSIAVDWRFTPNVIYIGSQRGVYRSVDLGVHWKRFGKDMPNTNVSDLQTLPTHSMMAASTSGRGVFEILLSEPKATLRFHLTYRCRRDRRSFPMWSLTRTSAT